MSTAPTQHSLRLDNVSLRAAQPSITAALHIGPLNLNICAGEIVTLMGASGCGKSTLLSWIIGNLNPAFQASGTLWLNDTRVDLLPTEQRKIGILFQDDLLFPHLTVGGNLAFALPAGKSKAERQEEIEQALSETGLSGFYHRDPQTLSGGQRARVSLLRTLMASPHALLLDEPFAKLDHSRRQQLREFVYEQITQRNIPTLLVTHDPADTPPQGRIIMLTSTAAHPEDRHNA
ncbi:MAG: ATP-binding cassette domain-containing protein [Plesiomonas sp.]|uniref:ATP-binding cassette domain-containing protein n=1 Tax=Plesiomonas sp. TaxID=2486279 RepID=UPI003F3A4C16